MCIAAVVDWPGGRNRKNHKDRLAAYSWTLVCQEATSGIRSQRARNAPMKPSSLGPVIWMTSGLNSRTVRIIKGR